jgi:tetratricopeptide (TPR) repeat protein
LPAQLERAKIHLEKEGNIDSFIQCHETLMNLKLEQQPQLCMALGSAYIDANFYKLALQCYNCVFTENRLDVKAACCVGQTLMYCHQYQQASGLYLSLLDTLSGNITIRFELASVFINMFRIADTRKILNELIIDILQYKDSQYLYKCFSLLIKLSNVLLYQRDYKQSFDVLLESIRLFSEHKKIFPVKAVLVEGMRDHISTLIVKLFSFDVSNHDYEDSMEIFRVSLEIIENDEKIYSAMLNMMFEYQNYDDCVKYFEIIHTSVHSCEDIIILSGKLSIIQSNLNQAYSQFKSYITHNVHNVTCYKAIYQLLPLLNRMNKFNEMMSVVEILSKEYSRKTSNTTIGGFHLCLVRLNCIESKHMN